MYTEYLCLNARKNYPFPAAGPLSLIVVDPTIAGVKTLDSSLGNICSSAGTSKQTAREKGKILENNVCNHQMRKLRNMVARSSYITTSQQPNHPVDRMTSHKDYTTPFFKRMLAYSARSPVMITAYAFFARS